MQKRIISVLMCLAMLTAFAGCKEAGKKPGESSGTKHTAAPSASGPAAPDRSTCKEAAETVKRYGLQLSEKAMELLERIWKPPAPIRMLTVTAIHLTEEGDAWQQEDLFTPVPQQEKQQKQEKLEQAMDSIRGKYGKTAIRFGASHITKEEDPLP